jgi:hypothetical protein
MDQNCTPDSLPMIGIEDASQVTFNLIYQHKKHCVDKNVYLNIGLLPGDENQA